MSHPDRHWASCQSHLFRYICACLDRLELSESERTRRLDELKRGKRVIIDYDGDPLFRSPIFAVLSRDDDSAGTYRLLVLPEEVFTFMDIGDE